MKFETIGNNKKKVKITIGIVCVIVIIGITAFTLTRASYKQTQSVPLIKGNISYNKSDLEIVAIKLQQDNGTYSDATSIPTSGYKLNTDIAKSYCKVGSTTSMIDYKYDNGTWYIKAKTKGSKCYLTFDKGEPVDNFIKTILDANGGAVNIVRKGNPDFSKTATTNEGMYAMEDDDGVSYYFRGTPTNNYVKFGKHSSNYLDTTKAGKDMYWRIIRINGDGTIRLIYDGSEYNANGTAKSQGIIPALRQLFNSKSGRNAEYVGYKYALGTKRANMADSNAKTELEKWYISSGLSNYSSYLADSGFCGDRTSTTTSGGIPNNTGGTGTIDTYYGAYYRLITKKEPTLKCSTISYGSNSTYEKGSKLDLYTTFGNKRGNQVLDYPIGMISADEVALAGGISNSNNNKYYLYNGIDYWTMSPKWSVPVDDIIYVVSTEGALEGHADSHYDHYLRPVINIDPTKINNVSIDSNGVYVIS